MDLTPLGTLRARILAPSKPRLTVVLLHGFGAPGDDLVALADFLDVDHTAFVFPEAPLELGGAFGDARAWWQIDMERDRTVDRSGEIPPGLPEARTAMIGALEALTRQIAAPVVLGGFSQGAMLALDVALHDPRPLAGLALLSGTLLNRADWEARLPSRAGLRVLQSHGKGDALLSYKTAVQLRDLMKTAGLDVKFLPFDGGHEIPPPLLEELETFLRADRETPGARRS
jgi:phospholipase/carboxylesterase